MFIFRYHGYVGAALILGGVDLSGPSLYTIYPHGSIDSLPYVTMGSGCLAAMAVFERGWKEDLSVSIKCSSTKYYIEKYWKFGTY